MSIDNRGAALFLIRLNLKFSNFCDICIRSFGVTFSGRMHDVGTIVFKQKIYFEFS